MTADLLARIAVASELTGASLLRLLSGDEYDTGALFEGVADTNTKRVVLENNTTDTVALILQPSVHATGQVYFRRSHNVTVDTEGTILSTSNAKTDEPDATDINVFTAGDSETGAISGGTDHPQLTEGSGTNNSNAGAGASEGASITNVIMPGDNFAVSAQNQSGGTLDLSLSWVFVLVPESQLERLPYK